MRQKEYFTIVGVFMPVPKSRNSVFSSRCRRRNSEYRSAAIYQPSSSTKVSSQRRFIVIGLPLNMDGTEGERAEKSRKLAKTLQIWSGLPVRMWDERQSTCEAADILSETGTFGARRKEILDSVSATVILEDYLAWRKEHPGEI